MNPAPSNPAAPFSGRIVAIVGPSASGKSAVAIELALLLNSEIVSVDSMQIYRGMDIGTAKPSAADQSRVRHHLIDVTEANLGFDAAAYRAAAVPVIDALHAQGKTPVLCGGTGFYFAVLLRGLGESPAGAPALRAALEETSTERLLEELRRCDPAAYAAIDRQNRRRLLRAVEVFRLTGRPFSEQRPTTPPTGRTHPAQNEASWRTFGLQREPDDLRARIAARVDAMFQKGWVDETRRLLAAGLGQNRTALQAIGYHQIAEHLRGDRTLAATRELILTRTCQLARRQRTWFRRQMQVTWLPVGSSENPRETAARIARELSPELL